MANRTPAKELEASARFVLVEHLAKIQEYEPEASLHGGDEKVDTRGSTRSNSLGIPSGRESRRMDRTRGDRAHPASAMRGVSRVSCTAWTGVRTRSHARRGAHPLVGKRRQRRAGARGLRDELRAARLRLAGEAGCWRLINQVGLRSRRTTFA